MIDVAMRQRWADLLRQHGLPPIKVHVTYDYSLPDDEEDAKEPATAETSPSTAPRLATAPTVPNWCNAAEASDLLGVSPCTVRDYSRRGLIATTHARIGGTWREVCDRASVLAYARKRAQDRMPGTSHPVNRAIPRRERRSA